ncbi:MAG: hypothetical protein ACK52I_22315 [Pseudomonadota bacterium]|jgi:hypothetical protein
MKQNIFYGNQIQLNKVELVMIKRLASSVRYLPGCYDKKFINDIYGKNHLSLKQLNFVKKLFDKYRKQIFDYQELVLQIDPERFKIEIKNPDLFDELKIKITDTKYKK